MSMVEIVTLLYFHWMRIRPDEPAWPERDRFILSKGHGAPSLYVALSMRGYFPDGHFRHFRQLGGILQGHPDRNKIPGVDCSTGSLGQGLGVGCGLALGARLKRASYLTYVLMSDGECNEGSVWEAAMIAGNLNIDNLFVLIDRNGKSSYGEMTGRNDVEPLDEKWRAFGWNVAEADGHDYASLSAALAQVEATPRPGVVLCKTVKGKGIPYVENNRTPSNFSLSRGDRDEAMRSLERLKQEIES